MAPGPGADATPEKNSATLAFTTPIDMPNQPPVSPGPAKVTSGELEDPSLGCWGRDPGRWDPLA